MSILISWLALTASFAAAAYLLPGFKVKGGATGLFIAAAIFGTLSFFLGQLLYLMIGLGTFGIGFLLSFVTRLVVATLLLHVTDRLTDRLTIKDLRTAFLAALVTSVVGTGVEMILDRVI